MDFIKIFNIIIYVHNDEMYVRFKEKRNRANNIFIRQIVQKFFFFSLNNRW